MKHLAIFGAAAAAFAIASPAAAQSGHAGVSWGTTSGDAEFDALSVNGSVALSPNIQIDGRYARLDDDGDEADAWTLGGHFLFERNNAYAWGGYAGFNSFEEGGFEADEWTAALEGAYYAERTTFSGALSYTSADYVVDVDQWAIDGEARHFLNDNMSIQANAGFANADASGADADGWNAGVGGEWQLENSGFSFNAGYQHTDFDTGSSDFIGVGVRYNFGGATLLQRNREGAGLNRPTGFLERVLGDLSPR